MAQFRIIYHFVRPSTRECHTREEQIERQSAYEARQYALDRLMEGPRLTLTGPGQSTTLPAEQLIATRVEVEATGPGI